MALYEKSKLKDLSKEEFLSPGSEYRGTPFWSWNCEVTEDKVREQAEIYKEMGMGGFHIHARTGLKTPYMGAEFMKYVRQADEWAKENNMLVWLYDEDRFPSGAAGGIVTENMRYRARHLVLTRRLREDLEESRAAFEERISKGEKPSGYYLASYAVTLRDGYLAEYKRTDGTAAVTNVSGANAAYRGSSELKALWHLYVELMPESPWYNDQTYLDTLNPAAVREFIHVTHEKYAQEFGSEFGKSIPAIFTDEPHMTCKMTLPFACTDQPVTMAYTDDIPESFEAAYHTPFLDIVPEIFWELPGGAVSVHRYHYHDHLSERFAMSYPDQIGEWCREHNFALTGHFLSERTLFSQTLALGEAMRCYRSMGLPGIDILCDQKELSTAKQAVSVARQYGREGVICEMYGVTHWDADFKCYKLQGDWLAALGITIRCQHLTFMSMEGEAKRDWPASIGYQSPWYQKYSYVEDHFARLNTALTRGKTVVKVGVIHPIESFWLSFGPNDQTQTRRDQMDENFENLMRWLLYGTIDFDLISEALLPELCGEGWEESQGTEEILIKGECQKAEVFPEKRKSLNTKASLKVGEMEYEAILVPDLRTIRSTTLSRLRAFAANGGTVVFAGRVPDLVDGIPSGEAKEFADGRKEGGRIEFSREALLAALDCGRVVEIRQENGKLSDNLFYQMREDGDDRWLFICHVNRKNNRLGQPENYHMTVRGEYLPVCYDTLTGEIKEMSETEQCAGYEYRDGNTRIDLKLYAQDSLLLQLLSTKAVGSDSANRRNNGGAKNEPEIIEVIMQPEAFELTEPNALLLDYASYCLNDGPKSERMEILRIDNAVRQAFGYPRRQDKFTQPWRLGEEEPRNYVTLYYEFDSAYEADGTMLAIERPENARVVCNGQKLDMTPAGWYVDKSIRTVHLPKLKHGTNELAVTVPFVRMTNLENLYILGEFGVDLRGTRAVMTAPLTELYFGDITRQRLPFYTGSVLYKNRITIPADGDYTVTVPHYKAPVMEVFLDGEQKGIIAYAPHRLNLAGLKAGRHLLEIKLYGNRFNGFGTLHNCNDEYMWYGPDSYRTEGDQWSEEYEVRKAGILSRIEIGRVR